MPEEVFDSIFDDLEFDKSKGYYVEEVYSSEDGLGVVEVTVDGIEEVDFTDVEEIFSGKEYMELFDLYEVAGERLEKLKGLVNELVGRYTEDELRVLVEVLVTGLPNTENELLKLERRLGINE